MLTRTYGQSRWLPALALTLAPLTHAQDAVDLNFTARPQLAGALCWAATTQMIVDYFGQPKDEHDKLFDQNRIAAYAFASPGDPAFQNWLDSCNQKIANCNKTFDPVLEPLGFTFGPQLDVLPLEMILADLRDARRPIIFGWLFPQTRPSERIGHYMLLTGYHHNKNGDLRLHVYDPLPVAKGSTDYISYENFSTTTPISLKNEMGAPWKSDIDYYNIAPGAPKVAALPARFHPAVFWIGAPASAGSARAMTETAAVSLSQASVASRPYAQAALAKLTPSDFMLPDTASFKLALGVPLPIVAPGLDVIRHAEPDSSELLPAETRAVLYPVLKDGHVWDRLLLIKVGDRWVSGGYANKTATLLLDQYRRERAPTDAQRAEYFLLSVPELGAYFLAHGSGPGATLIPVAEDPALQNSYGRPLPANQPVLARDLFRSLKDVLRRLDSQPPAPPRINDGPRPTH